VAVAGVAVHAGATAIRQAAVKNKSHDAPLGAFGDDTGAVEPTTAQADDTTVGTDGKAG